MWRELFTWLLLVSKVVSTSAKSQIILSVKAQGSPVLHCALEQTPAQQIPVTLVGKFVSKAAKEWMGMGS